jgi:hypothetical protein
MVTAIAICDRRLVFFGSNRAKEKGRLPRPVVTIQEVTKVRGYSYIGVKEVTGAGHSEEQNNHDHRDAACYLAASTRMKDDKAYFFSSHRRSTTACTDNGEEDGPVPAANKKICTPLENTIIVDETQHTTM